jgi:iron complex outermembrane recepter protein
VDAAAYLINWSNVQTLLNLPTCGIPTTINMGDARSMGVDLALSTRVFKGLSLGVAVGYNNSKYTSDFPGPNNVILRRSGEPLGVPPWTAYLNGQYDFALGAALDGYVRADYSYSSHDHTPLYTQSPLVDPGIPRPPSTSELNLRADAIFNGWDVSLFVDNALNAHPLLGLYHNLAGTGDFRAITFRPRTIGLTVTIRK